MYNKNIYEQILEIAVLAEKMEYEYRNEVEQEENKEYIKKVINKPKRMRKIPYEAYLAYFNKKTS